MRIFVGGIMHETNSFNPIPTRVDDFVIARGDDLLDDPGVAPHCGGDVDIVSGFLADAIPSGPIEGETYQYFKGSLLRAIEEAGALDGICLFLHGAMLIEDIDDGEVDLLRSVRNLVGDEILISVSLDLHGNIAAEIAGLANICTAYRTAPHVDMEDTRGRAVALLIDSIRRSLSPRVVVQKIPVMIAGDPAITSEKPASTLYARLDDIDRKDGILNSSLLIGYSWNDSASIGSSVIVTASDVERLDVARSEAAKLAAEFWNVRGEFRFTVPAGSIDETIEMSNSCHETPTFISDSGDNVTSGAAGDIPMFIERLLALGTRKTVYAGVIDPEAVNACRKAGVGSKVSIALGGKLDTINGTPLAVDGRVVNVVDEGVVLAIDHIEVIVARRRTAFTTLDSFKAFGVDPMHREVIVVKLGYLFPELAAVAARSFIAISPGFASQKLDLPYKRIPRPIYPLDPDMTWEP